MIERPLKILVGADVPCNPNSGAAGTVFQTNSALRALGHKVDEIWAEELGRKIKHGNLHYLIELPRRYQAVVERRCEAADYDVIQLSQPHAYLAAEDHQRRGRRGVFVNRSHGVELRSTEVLKHYLKPDASNRTNIRERVLSPLLNVPIAKHWPRVAAASDGIIVGCREDETFVRERFLVPGSRVRAIHHGVSPDFRESSGSEWRQGREKQILYVGQFTALKAPELLAKIVNRTLVRFPDTTFTWVCSEKHHQLASGLFQHDIRERVRFSGWVSQRELVNVYDAHGIFLFPSFFEGFGKAPLEAMARGLCVVTSDTGGMRDVIENGKDGALCPVGDLETFVAGCAHLIQSPSECEEISRRAALTASRYTWELCAASAAEFYGELLCLKEAGSDSGTVI